MDPITNERENAAPLKRRLRVLLVEDSATDAELNQRALELAGYAVEAEQVQTGPDLQAALERGDWDLVLSDAAMPEFDGITALTMVKAMEPGLPVILVTGTLDEELARAALQAGARDCVVKGKPERLIPVIERELRVMPGFPTGG